MVSGIAKNPKVYTFLHKMLTIILARVPSSMTRFLRNRNNFKVLTLQGSLEFHPSNPPLYLQVFN